ncbi:nitrate regulatory gene2 protein-like isoform X1 [Papaver somniferum]|nr:nitrate regulatory gene2 protein-like isoform X1 [Papaver somniferum]
MKKYNQREMGCGNSKVDDLPLVIRCRTRKELIKAAVDHRYSLAASHITYFRSLKDVGDALRRFVDEELIIGGSNDHLNLSEPSSPVLTLPSEEGKKPKNNNNTTSSSTSISHNHHHDDDGHLHFEDSDSSVSSDSVSSGHIHSHDHNHDSPPHYHSEPPPIRQQQEQQPYYYPSQPNYYPSQPDFYPSQPDFYPSQPNYYPSQPNYYPSQPDYYNSQSQQPRMNTYFMKRSGTQIPSMIYEEPQSHSSSFYPSYPQYGGNGGGAGGYFGVPMGFPSSSPQNPPRCDPNFRDPYGYNQPQRNAAPSRPPSPPPPPAPEVSSWDFLNPFDLSENAYPNYPGPRYGNGTTSSSSPDSVEVRRREGIPDLEDEMLQQHQQRPTKESHRDKQRFRGVPDSGDGSSRSIHSNSRGIPGTGEGTSKAVPAANVEIKTNSVEEKESSSSPESITITESSGGEEEITRKKGVSFEMDMPSAASLQDNNGSLNPINLTAVSTNVTRDIDEVVKEIRDEFEVASGYGKEVGVMLEVGKLRYQSTGISSKILNLVAPTTSKHSHNHSTRSRPASVMKMAKTNYGEPEEFKLSSGSLSATLERLYAWEKKLFKEVKDEERLRVVYEKKCKRLKNLDDRGAESNKIEATQIAIRKLLTKINIAIRAIESISSRINKLRDEELQPQITELIHGLIRMWKNMLRCHHKQFQAIVESKNRTLVARTGAGRDSSLKATVELQVELLNWSNHFSDWISTQRSYIESLNGWLLGCLVEEPEETSDGVMPFSPGRAGAPPIFVICNDWYQAFDRLSETEVANTMNAFALSLHQLWERQDEEQRQRLKADYLSKDFEKRLRTLQKKEIKTRSDLDTLSEKSVVPTGSGVSHPLDDLKVDLDSMRKRLEDEKAIYKETVKQVHEAASTSLQSGLIPIFETLENFTSETLKAYESVRIQNVGQPA